MNDKKVIPLLGAHMSIEGGLYKALERGASINCSTIQIFTSSNRQWYSKSLTQEEITLFKTTKKTTRIACTISHCSYLLNLASDKKEIREKSIKALSEEIIRCQLLDIPYLVLHPGSRLSNSLEKACEYIATGIELAYQKANTTNPTLLLETMAGQGSSIGGSFRELKTIISRVSSKRIGVCFDTCHVFAAGYIFNTKTTYDHMWETFDQEIGLSRLHAFHLNDSKRETDSHIDRHEAIGEGFIGIDAFAMIMNDKNFTKIPKIIETPKTTLAEDKKNIETLLNLLRK